MQGTWNPRHPVGSQRDSLCKLIIICRSGATSRSSLLFIAADIRGGNRGRILPRRYTRREIVNIYIYIYRSLRAQPQRDESSIGPNVTHRKVLYSGDAFQPPPDDGEARRGKRRILGRKSEHR